VSVEIRSARADELPAFRSVSAYAFGSQERDPGASTSPSLEPEWTTCAFVDGCMAATLLAFPFRMYLNGECTDVAGVSMVATLPEFRRRGLLRDLMQRGLREQRERGQSLAILWASYVVSRATRTADLVMPINALAALLPGHRSATELARAGLVEARDPAALRRADRLFAAPYRPWCLDGF